MCRDDDKKNAVIPAKAGTSSVFDVNQRDPDFHRDDDKKLAITKTRYNI